MRNLMFFCAALAMISSIVAVNLWRELRAERELTANLQTQLNASGMAATATVGPSSLPVPQPDAGTRGRAQTPQQPASGSAEAAAGTAAAQPRLELPGFILSQQEMMKDPEYQKARLAQTRMNLPQNYPGLVEELGLTPEEADQLFDLLARNQLEISDTSLLAATVNGVAPDPAAMESASRRRVELQRKQEDELMAMLGGQRYSQWQDYQGTRGARQQVTQLSRALESAGVPLAPEQSKPLTAVYAAEQRRMQEETQRMLASLRSSGPADQGRMMEERLKLQAESNRRIIDGAKRHLNSQQLDALQSSLEQQLVMNRASNRVRQQMQAQGQNATPVNSITISTAPAAAVPIF
jgi:hypothetical protein